MKDFDLIYSEIKRRYKAYTKKDITENSVIDFYTVAIADTAETIYKDIEDMKNPHIYSKLKEKSLDDLGFFMNMPREADESDHQYLYRLMNWKYSAEASNLIAINNALLNTKHSSDAEYIPRTNGSGTASVYIIPTTYAEEDITKAVEEAMELVQPIVSPSMYVEYVIPVPLPVIVHVALSSKTGDVETIKRTFTQKVKEYINRIPPNEYLEIGQINRIGINEELVDYFSVLQLFIDNVEQDGINIFQGINQKYLVDEIVWTIE